jgi:hypothetical protein
MCVSGNDLCKGLYSVEETGQKRNKSKKKKIVKFFQIGTSRKKMAFPDPQTFMPSSTPRQRPPDFPVPVYFTSDVASLHMEIGHEGNGEQEGCRMITILGNLSLCGWFLGPLFDDQVRSCTNLCRDGSTNFPRELHNSAESEICCTSR